jgi:hypothetical protein
MDSIDFTLGYKVETRTLLSIHSVSDRAESGMGNDRADVMQQHCHSDVVPISAVVSLSLLSPPTQPRVPQRE